MYPTPGENSLLYRFVSGLAYSNIFIAVEAVAMALVTILLSGYSLRPEALFIPFASFFIIYSMDRYLGTEEDEDNNPVRTRFVRRYGKFFFALSIFTYSIALLLSLDRSLEVFVLAVFPVALSVAYSPFNFKRFLIIGNSIVGIAWGSVPLLVGAYYGDLFTAEALFLSAFFTVSWFRNATLFDIKDIRGDLEEGVRTIPNQFGIFKTKVLAVFLNLCMLVSWVFLVNKGVLDAEFLILSFFHTYLFVYLQLVDMEAGELFYSIVIDGECKFLGFVTVVAALGGIL